MPRQTIPLIRVNPKAVLPTRATAGSFGYDLTIPDTHTIFPGETKVLGTGWKLAIGLPAIETAQIDSSGNRETVGGVSLLVLPRGSLCLKYGLIVPNSPGLVDMDYTGEIGVIAHNIKQEPVTIYEGTRIAQAVLVMMDFFPIVEGFEMAEREERGGFGSTGA